MAYAKKVDKNQALVVKALRDCGADVFLLHMVGGGIPDLLCCYEAHSMGQSYSLSHNTWHPQRKFRK